MRPQVTTYFSADAKQWLATYARALGLKESEVLRLLAAREREVQWLRWACTVPDPEQGKPSPIRHPSNRPSRRSRRDLGPKGAI